MEGDRLSERYSVRVEHVMSVLNGYNQRVS